MRYLIITLIAILYAPANRSFARTSEEIIKIYPDSLLTIPNIRKAAANNPDEALSMLDQAEEKRAIAPYKINWTRAQIYGSLKEMGRMALKYGEIVLADDSVKNNPKNYINMCHNIIEQLISFKRYDKALEYVDEMLKVAGNDEKLIAKVKHDAFWSVALVNREKGNSGKANFLLNEAIKACKEANLNDLQTNLNLNKYYQLKVEWLLEDNKFDEALQNAFLLDSITEEMRQYRGGSYPDRIPEKHYQGFEAMSTCILAKAYYKVGDVKKAQETYKKIEKSSSLENDLLVIYKAINYLVTANHNDEAIRLTLPIAAANAFEDSINNKRFEACRILTDLYMKKGDLKSSNKYASTALMLSDSLKKRENDNDALELATLLETNEKEKMIRVQMEELKRHKVITYSACAMLILAIIIITVISISSRIMARKNRLMAKQLKNGLTYRDELLAAQEKLRKLETNSVTVDMEPAHNNNEEADDSAMTNKEENKEEVSQITNEDKSCFNDLDIKIRSEKLYLDPDLTRDKILQIINISKNRLSPMIQAFTGENLNGYINGLRLEYSLKLLKENDKYTIEAVAMDSGFNNIRTYQRLFRNKYGMSPAQFKKSLE